MFNDPFAPKTIADLKQFLGPVKAVRVWDSLPEGQYHNELEGFSSSTLKDYLKDPITAFQRRVTGQATEKKLTEDAKRVFRFGRALHCFVLEGVEKFKINFPVFGGKARVGKAWQDMLIANPKAQAADDILTAPECVKVESLGRLVKSQYLQHLAAVEAQGQKRHAKFNELSISVEYVSGLKVKIRCDELILWYNPQTQSYFYEIVDLKSTDRSVNLPVDLAFALEDYGYDLSAVLYANTLYDALFAGVPVTGAPKGLVIPGLQNPNVFFTLLWASKGSGLTAVQSGIVSANIESSPPGVLDWGAMGRTKLILALTNYQREVGKFMNIVQGSHTRQDALALRPNYITSMPIKKHEYLVRDMLAELNQNQLPQFSAATPEALNAVLEQKWGNEWRGKEDMVRVKEESSEQEVVPKKTPPPPPAADPPEETTESNSGWSFNIPPINPPEERGEVTSHENLQEIATKAEANEAAITAAIDAKESPELMYLNKAQKEFVEKLKGFRKKEKFMGIYLDWFKREYPDLNLAIDFQNMELKEIKKTISKTAPNSLFLVKEKTE